MIAALSTDLPCAVLGASWVPVPVIAHAADLIALAPIVVVVFAMLVKTTLDRRRAGAQEDKPPSFGASLLLGLRTVGGRMRRRPGRRR